MTSRHVSLSPSRLLGHWRHEVLANGIVSDGAVAMMATAWDAEARECILVRASGLRNRAENRLVKVPIGSGGGTLMGWTRRGVDDARTWQARRRISLILAVAGAAILAATGIGCGNPTTGASINAAGVSGSGCPTQGVGGDTVAPVCVSQPGGSGGGTTGIHGPQSVSATPALHTSGPVTQPAPSSSRGIAGPARASASASSGGGVEGPPIVTPGTPPVTPGGGIGGPVSVSASPPPSGSVSGPATVQPSVTGISPSSGPAAGGTSVTITGSGLSGATMVDFGGVGAVMTVNSDTEIIAISPPGTGTVDITVMTPGGAFTTGPEFSYVS